MNFIKARRMLGFVRRAIDDYGMIEDGDRIAVGVSGGKDSMTLLCVMKELQRFYPKRFEIVGITVNTGFEGMDFSPIKSFCEKLGVEYHIEDTNIAKIVFDIRKETNPCSLCANLRRGALHNAALKYNCNKLALGHHFDDVIGTFMMNLIHEGRIGCFSPVTYLSNKQISMFRPMIYSKESDVKYFMNHNPEIPLVKNTCPEDKNTERENVGNLLDMLERENEGTKHRIFTAIQNAGLDGFKPPIKDRKYKEKNNIGDGNDE